ncbi:TPA: RHS repeat-associated core domain-containing protein [Vibrio parahaemolyticus]
MSSKILTISVLSLFVLCTGAKANAELVNVDHLIGGDLKANAGKANYSVLIETPSGRNDFTPKVSFDYYDTGKNGRMGVSWGIGGISVISRCSSNLAKDGVWKGVTLTSSDKFCLDGVRLVNIKGNHYSNGAIYKEEVNSKGYIKLETSGGEPYRFTVYRTDGSTLKYLSHKTSSGQKAVNWFLMQATDSSGNNVINYDYENQHGKIKEINYHGGSLKFVYENRPDAFTTYIHGEKNEFKQRLSQVAIYNRDNTLKHTYHLSYTVDGVDSATDSAGSNRSLLSEIWLQTPSGLKSNTIKFNWHRYKNNQYQYSDYALASIPSSGLGPVVFARDSVKAVLDHDLGRYKLYGKQFWKIRVYHGGGSTTERPHAKYYSPDGTSAEFSAEICTSRPNGSSDCREDEDVLNFSLTGDVFNPELSHDEFEYHNGRGNFVTTSNKPRYGDFSGDGYPTPAKSNAQLIGDINGDNVTDTLYVQSSGSNSYKYLISGFTEKTVPSHNNRTFKMLIDINNDGYFDLVTEDNNNWYVHLFNGVDFLSPTTLIQGKNPSDGGTFLDVNSDGYPDFIYQERAYLNKSGTISSMPLSNFTCSSNGYCGDHVGTYNIDTNGDGIGDFITVNDLNASSQSSRVYVSTPKIQDRLYRIEEGVIDYDINYELASSESVYENMPYSSFPVKSFTPQGYLLESILITPRNEQSIKRTYFYKGALKHFKGYGNLGFKQISETVEAETKTRTITEYEQNSSGSASKDALIGKPTKITEQVYKYGTFRRAKESTLIYEQNKYSSREPLNLSIVNTSQVTEDTYDLLTQEKITFTRTKTAVNRYNQVKSIEVATSYDWETFKKTTDVTYLTEGDTLPEDAWKQGAQTEILSTSQNSKDTHVSRERYEYTSEGFVKSLERTGSPSNSSVIDASVFNRLSYTYDNYGNVSKSIETASGTNETRTTTFSWSSDGYDLQSSTNAMGHTNRFTYNGNGLITGTTDSIGVTETFEYDEFDRQVKSTIIGTSIQVETDFEFGTSDCSGHLYCTKTSHSSGSVENLFYNANGQIAERQHNDLYGDLVSVKSSWNSRGQNKCTSAPHYTTDSSYREACRTYDEQGRLITVRKPFGESDEITHNLSYDKLTITETDPERNTKSIDYNGIGQIERVDYEHNTSVSYTYYPNGNIRTLKDRGNNEINIVYDGLGNRTQVNDPSFGIIQYFYNGFGEPMSSSKANGSSTQFTYDLIGRKLSERNEHNGHVTNAYWDYDDEGSSLLQSESRDGTTTNYDYDALGNLKKRVLNVNDIQFTTEYGVDAYNRPISEVKRDTKTSFYQKINYAYTSSGYLYRKYRDIDGTDIWRLNETDAFGHVLKETLGNGLVNNYTYLSNTNYVSRIKTGGDLRDTYYSYDRNGNLTHYDNSHYGDTASYSYDNLDRLHSSDIKWSSSSSSPNSLANYLGYSVFHYDHVGNLDYKTGVGDYQYDGLPYAVSATDISSYRYDQSGFMTGAMSKDGTKDNRTITWTGFGKVDTITAGIESSSFSYDANNFRVIRADNNGDTTIYIGDGLDLSIEDGGSKLKYSQSILGSYGLVAFLNYEFSSSGSLLNSKALFTHTNALGSIEVITDINANVVDRIFYDAWGEQYSVKGEISTENQGGIQNRSFTGHEKLKIGDVVHMNGRIYDQQTGRFLSPDPEIQSPTNPLSINRYSYVWNNPLKYTDPTGFNVEGTQDTISQASKLNGESQQSGALNDGATIQGETSTNISPGDSTTPSTTPSSTCLSVCVGTSIVNGQKYTVTITLLPDNYTPNNYDGNKGSYADVTPDASMESVNVGLGKSTGVGVWGIGVELVKIGIAFTPIGTAYDLGMAALTGYESFKQGNLSVGLQDFGLAVLAIPMKKVKILGKVSNRAFGTHRQLKNAGVKDSHHVIQDAAAKNISGYSRMDAPAIQLNGPSTLKGSEHYIATQVQRQIGGGTYAAERRIGYKALRKAGVSQSEARAHIQRADNYFGGLGVTSSTQMRQVGNRNR